MRLSAALSPAEIGSTIAEQQAEIRRVLSGSGTLRVRTSGSTGEPKPVELSGAALRASATASAVRLGAVGRWVLALPVDYIAGLQVLLRAHLAAEAGVSHPLVHASPSVEQSPGSVTAITSMLQRAHQFDNTPVFISLVPTQLRRCLADPLATAQLADCHTVLAGGASCPAALVTEARAHGINVVRTYGMTETAGGCVYDGIPLDGVQVRIAASDESRAAAASTVVSRRAAGAPQPTDSPRRIIDAKLGTGGVGRIEIAGPMLAEGIGAWLRTNDLGRITPNGRLEVLGRIDDVIVSGGVKIQPATIATALGDALGGAEVVVVGIPDDDWGQAVQAFVVGKYSEAELAVARAVVAEELGAAHAPKRLLAVSEIPRLGSGKPDCARLAEKYVRGAE
jgi:o-succinylbenzoate---CoA ligase